MTKVGPGMPEKKQDGLRKSRNNPSSSGRPDYAGQAEQGMGMIIR
jgi:hypothetical protein